MKRFLVRPHIFHNLNDSFQSRVRAKSEKMSAAKADELKAKQLANDPDFKPEEQGHSTTSVSSDSDSEQESKNSKKSKSQVIVFKYVWLSLNFII